MGEQMTTNLVTKLRDREKPFRLYVAATGAGAGLQGRLWDVPGASSFLAGASFPYAQDATAEFLGFEPTHGYCSREMAIDLAMESYRRAYDPQSKAEPVGLGITASVASLQAHRGEHRVHVAVMARDCGILAMHIGLPKDVGAAARRADGETTDRVGLSLLMIALGMPELAEPFTEGAFPMSYQARELFFERGLFASDGQRVSSRLLGSSNVAFLPGSFNPPHNGHFGAAEAVRALTGKRIIFSVTANPPHKDPLGLHDMLERAKMLRGKDVVFTEGDALFIEKARRFPGASFIVGADTARRMLDPKWCPVEPMIDEFRDLGTKFYVLGRVQDDGGFVTLADIPEARGLGDIFKHVDGRWDISSTQLRASAAE
jgi:cytidyltransferase-like protein